jgi:molybdopterin-guanine dinucleotide biosynthesis protein A
LTHPPPGRAGAPARPRAQNPRGRISRAPGPTTCHAFIPTSVGSNAPVRFDAVVLAGGRARRLSGADKATIDIGGRTLLERVLAAVNDARTVVVVGPRRTDDVPGILWVEEHPSGAGPVHALAAGLQEVDADLVAVVAVDLPFVTPAVIRRLRDAARGRDGALAIDAEGRDQLMLGVYRTTSLHGRIAALEETTGASMKELIDGLDVARVDEAASAFDCDTADDVVTATQKAGELDAGSVDRRGV